MIRSRTGRILATALAIVQLACSNNTVIDDSCFGNSAHVTSRSNTMSVGDTMTFSANLGPAECLPADVVSEDWRWFSSDTLMVKIDSLSGLAEAVGPGLLTIAVRHAVDPAVSNSTGLHVLGQ